MNLHRDVDIDMKFAVFQSRDFYGINLILQDNRNLFNKMLITLVKHFLWC